MFAVVVNNSTGIVTSNAATLTVNAAPAPLQITASVLPNAQAGIPFQAGLTATGGVTPYRWSIVSGTLPAGVSLNAASGMISGTPLQGGQVDFVAQVGDSSPSKAQTAMKALTLYVLSLTLQINSAAMPNGQVGVPFQALLSGSGGVVPYTWTAVGALPSGLSLNASSGAITGTPTQASASTPVTIVLTDSSQQTVHESIGVTILPAATQPLSISTTTLTQPVIPQSYSQTLQATGGTPPYAWTVASGQLPRGLLLNPTTGQLSGTPLATGTFPFTATVQDSTAHSASASFSVTVSISPWNPSVLGVSWAGDFTTIAANEINVKSDPRLTVKAVGDGVTDDTSAIRAAIQLASSSGGGIVYFPASDYKIIASSGAANGSPLVVPSRTILRGDSLTYSRIFVNDLNAASETDGTWTWGGIDFQGSSLSGMTDLGVFAVNASTTSCAALWNRGSTSVSELFFNNLNIKLANCKPFWFEGVAKLLFQGNDLDSSNTQTSGNASQYGPIYIAGIPMSRF